MGYNEKIAGRVRRVLSDRAGVTEQKMFGGLCFLINGNMCCGVQDGSIVLRLGEDGADEALKRKHTRSMDFTGRVIKSMVYVDGPGFTRSRDLRRWVELAAGFAEELPAKAR